MARDPGARRHRRCARRPPLPVPALRGATALSAHPNGRRTTALIAGGGPAGAAAAILLARAGAAPLLVERTRAPHDVVCGGFLGWDALAAMRALGLDAAALGAHPIRRVRLVAAGRIVEADLPFAAAGLSRRTLDAALLVAAVDAGAGIERGVTIRRAEGDSLHFADGGVAAGASLFLATGKHELRGAARDHRGVAPSAGFRTSLPAAPGLAAALRHTIELHLFDGGYAGLLLQEDGRANLCLSIDPARLPGHADALLRALAGEAPLLADRAATATAWSAIAGVPYGWRTAATLPGRFRLGDQAAVIASLAGDGVAIALASARSAAGAWVRHGADGAAVHQRAFAAHVRRPLAVAGLARRLVESRALRPPALALLARLPLLPALARATRVGH